MTTWPKIVPEVYFFEQLCCNEFAPKMFEHEMTREKNIFDDFYCLPLEEHLKYLFCNLNVADLGR